MVATELLCNQKLKHPCLWMRMFSGSCFQLFGENTAQMEAARINYFSGDVTLSVWISFESEKNVANG